MNDPEVKFIDEPKMLAFKAIIEERRRQDAKWGEQNHTDLRWLPILVEEVGELAKAINEGIMTGGELTQVAAVTLAWMECHERSRKALVDLPKMPPPDAPPCGGG
jgi:NTP pyrophosphatase (non-canonical NTP hydrolase)